MSRRTEAGFTLAEVVITVPIMVMLTGALAGALVVGWRTTERNQTRLVESHDAQLLQFSLLPDVQSVAPSGIDTEVTSTVTCADTDRSVPPDGSPDAEPGSNVLTLLWAQETFGTTKTFEASYRLVDTGGPNGFELRRYYCENAAIAIEKVVAKNVQPSPAPVVTVGGGSTPRKIAMTVTKTSGYTFTVEGEWRRSPDE